MLQITLRQLRRSLGHIAAKAKEKAGAVLHNFITAKSARRYYYSVFLPSVTYTFPTNVIQVGHLRNIQNAPTRPILNRLGYANSTLDAILFGPQALGGTGLRPIYDEQGSSKVELF
jgi:hypothetical protein